MCVCAWGGGVASIYIKSTQLFIDGFILNNIIQRIWHKNSEDLSFSISHGMC